MPAMRVAKPSKTRKSPSAPTSRQGDIVLPSVTSRSASQTPSPPSSSGTIQTPIPNRLCSPSISAVVI